jgi:hypothetical protein
LAFSLCLLCAAAVGGFWYWRANAAPDPAALARYLPPNVESIVGIDVAKLRRAGMLNEIAGPDGVEELDYRQFVEFTGFDYRTDLDYVLAGFGGGDTFVLAGGRFDWPALFQYAGIQGGVCQHGYCRMPSGTPSRRVSFFAGRRRLLALATGGNDWLATNLYDQRSWTRRPVPGSAPIWAYLSKRFLAREFPPGSGGALAVNLLKGGQEAWLWAEARELALDLRLEVICAEPAAAAAVKDRFTRASSEIHQLASRQAGQPDSLAAIVGGGQFSVTGSTMNGVWRLEPGLVSAIRGGRF